MVMLHDAIKTIQKTFLCFFLKKEQTPVLFEKTKNPDKKTNM